MRNAIVRNAKAKPIERTFYTVKNQFSKLWDGYCGGTILEHPESLKCRIKDGKLPCDYEIREIFDTWIDNEYNSQNYGGSENCYKELSRLDVWHKTCPEIRNAPKKYIGEVFSVERFVTKTGFSGNRETWIFLDCTLILTGDGLVSASVWLNSIAQTLRPKITLHDGEFSTLHFSFTTKISGGRHNIQIGVRGNADITDIQAFLWGQEITSESPEFTGDSDYLYTTDNGDTTVTGYIGKSVFPSIPDGVTEIR